MKKADVIRRSPNPNGYFGEWVPALNVKWFPWLPDLIRKFEGSDTHEFGDDAGFWQWVHACWDNDTCEAEFRAADEIAREDGWEQAVELAHEIFGSHVKVWSSGRSGGWLIVEGLPDIESWDAIALGRWARFAQGVQAILDDLDYQFIWHLYVNMFEPMIGALV